MENKETVLPTQDKESDRKIFLSELHYAGCIDEKCERVYCVERRERDSLLEFKKQAIEVLTSIAAPDTEELGDKEYWLNMQIDDCAGVIATDTNLARSFLEKWDK